MRKQYGLDEQVELPEKISKHITSQGVLFVGSKEPTWLLASAKESEVLDLLIKGYTPRESVQALSNRDFPDAVIDSLEKTLEKIVVSEFFSKELCSKEDGALPFHIYLTNSCNFKCVQCYRDSNEKAVRELDFDSHLRIIDQISDFGETKIVFSGGEPLLYDKIFSLLEYTKSRGHDVTLITNGSLIRSEEVARKLSFLTDNLHISLDGPTPETNDALRGFGTFEKIIGAINMFENTSKLIKINMTVTDENVGVIEREFENLYFNVIKTRPLQFNFSAIANYGRASGCYVQSIYKKKELTDRALLAAEKVGFSRKEWKPAHHKNLNCGYARGITIGEGGQVYFCPVANKTVETKFNILNTSIKDLVDVFKEEFISSSVTKNELCDPCDLLYVCGGGCRIENKLERGSLTNFYCTVEKKQLIYEELARFSLIKYGRVGI